MAIGVTNVELRRIGSNERQSLRLPTDCRNAGVAAERAEAGRGGLGGG